MPPARWIGRRGTPAARAAFALVCLVVTPGAIAGSPPPDREIERLDLRMEPFVDLHYAVLAHALPDRPAPDWMRPAAEAARAIGGSAFERAWAAIDVAIALHAPSLDEIRASVGRLPDAGIRERAAQYVNALAAIQPAFVADHWPARRTAIAEASAAIRARLAGKEQLAIDFIASRLGLRDPGGRLPVYLVAGGPFPGAFTRRAPGTSGIVFADVTRFSTTVLVETLLHETIHVLDLASPGGESALEQLRARLVEAGLPRSDRGFRDVPHTLMFVQAGETVRRLIDPGYDLYAHDYYARVPVATAAVKGSWVAYLEGTISRDQALDRIAGAFMADRKHGS